MQNQVKDLFNGLNQLTVEFQTIWGTVNASTPHTIFGYNVPYVYQAAQNNDSPTVMVYPNGRVVDYIYNSGLDSSISRVSGLAYGDSSNPSTVEAYTYLGLDSIVQRSHPENGVALTYINSAASTGNRYAGLDQFGRVIDQNWVNSSTGVSTDRFQYGYDLDGNVLYKNNVVTPANSELYRPKGAVSGDANSGYDPLGRLTNFARGTLTASTYNNGQFDGVNGLTQIPAYGLDAFGNMTSNATGGSTITRTFNAQNQESTNSVTPASPPLYDHDGNEIKNEGQTVAYVYDAWNRLTGVTNGAGTATLAVFNDDAIGRRVSQNGLVDARNRRMSESHRFEQPGASRPRSAAGADSASSGVMA